MVVKTSFIPILSSKIYPLTSVKERSEKMTVELVRAHKSAEIVDHVSFYLYQATDNWVHGGHAHTLNILNPLILYKLVLRIDYKKIT